MDTTGGAQVLAGCVPLSSACERGTPGRSNENVVDPGVERRATEPPCAAVIACTRDRPRPAPPDGSGAGRVAAGEPLEGVLRAGRRAARARRRGPRPASRRPRARRPPTVTVVPAGVCRRALLSRLVTTWCSRCSSPVASTGSSGRSSRQRWSGATTRASPTASSSQPGQVDLARGRAAGRSRAGPAAAGPRPARTSGWPRPRPWSSPATAAPGRPGDVRRLSSA